jgi:hypothetical protein
MKSTHYGFSLLALPLLISQVTRGAFMKKWVFGFVVAVVVSAPTWVRADEHTNNECRVSADESEALKLADDQSGQDALTPVDAKKAN